MSLFFQNFGNSGRSAWTTTIAPPAQQPRQSGPTSGGQAQPIQPQSQGTPYGQQPDRRALSAAPRAQDFAAYQPRPTQQAPANPFAQYNPQQIGNFVQQQMGLPSFQFRATDSFGNTYDNPAALTAQQGAMAQAMNAQRAQQIQSGNFGRLDPMAAYQQAQNMVQGGWTNPFAAQPVQPLGQGTPSQSPPTHAMYVAGADLTTLPYTDTLQPNPLYRGGQAQPVPPPSQGVSYGQPGGGRLEDTNPALWNESQWSEYETRQRNSGLADSGGYYRDRQGNVRYSGGLSGPGPIITPQTRRDQYGFWRDNPAPQTPAPPPPPPPRQANPNTPTFGVFPPGALAPPQQTAPASAADGVDAGGNYADPAFRAARAEYEARLPIIQQRKAAALNESAPRWRQLENLVTAAEAWPKGKLVKDSKGNWAYNPYQVEIDNLTSGPNAIPGAAAWIQARVSAPPGRKPKAPTNWSEQNELNTKPERDAAMLLKMRDLERRYAPPPSAAQLAKENQAWQAQKHADWMQETAGWQKSASPVLKWIK